MSIDDSKTAIRMGKVSFGGVTQDVALCYVPEAKIGDYVIVHVGFALSIVDSKQSLIEKIDQ